MAHPLVAVMRDTIVGRLKRKAITNCAKWAEKYRIMGEPFPGLWSFDHHPWLYEMHLAAEEGDVVGQKAAQMGYTEWAMNFAFYMMDIHQQNVLYVMPTTRDAGDFSATRFDPALELSPHLKDFFSAVNNVGLKRAGSTSLYVRGSHSRSQLKSIPAAVIIRDEVDEFPAEAIALSDQRQGGQLNTWTLDLSTPSIDGKGINKQFRLSSEEYYHFRCPSCDRYTQLIYPDCLVITAESLTDPNIENSYLKCKECDARLHHETKHEWLKPLDYGGTARFVPTYPGRKRGFHVSRLYSMAKAGRPRELAFMTLRARLDPTYAQELYNSVLGMTYSAEGAKVNDEMLHAARDGHDDTINPNRVRTMGIDVGAVLHIVIKEYYPNQFANVHGLKINDRMDAKLIKATTTKGTARDFDEAIELFNKYKCQFCVVDAEPERRQALQFAQRLPKRVLLCDYQSTQQGREAVVNKDECLIKVNRTSWLDLTLGRYKNGTIKLPLDISEEYEKHIKEPVRVYKDDRWGNKYATYVNAEADHYAHADNYSEIALPAAMGLGSGKDIVGFY